MDLLTTRLHFPTTTTTNWTTQGVVIVGLNKPETGREMDEMGDHG